MKTFGLALFLIAISTFCNSKKPIEIASPNAPFEPGVIASMITEEKLEEASGLAESINNPGYLWTHNDSGDDARIFLIDKQGGIKSIVTLAGINNRDWEDMAVGPGPETGKAYLYIGDIGDNEAEFRTKYIYRIEEPTIDTSKAKDTTLQKIDILKFEYPDGLRDAESLMIDPLTRDLFVISKRELKCNVYRLPYPQSASESVKAELAIEKIEFDKAIHGDTLKEKGEVLIKGYHPKYYYQIVAADISDDGNEVLVKSYSCVFYWQRNANESIVELLKRPPMLLPYNPEPQGEAVTFTNSGDGYYTLNERMRGKDQKLIFYKRKK